MKKCLFCTKELKCAPISRTSLFLSSASTFHSHVDLLSLPFSAVGPKGPQGSRETVLLSARPGVFCVGGWSGRHPTRREGWRRGATARRIYICSQRPRSLWQQAPSLGAWNLRHMIFIMASTIVVLLLKWTKSRTVFNRVISLNHLCIHWSSMTLSPPF